MKEMVEEYPHFIDDIGFSESPTPEMFVAGWCGTPAHQPLAELWVEEGGEFYPCLTAIERPDVASHLGLPSMNNSGFAARFPVLKADATLRFHAVRNGRAVFHSTATASPVSRGAARSVRPTKLDSRGPLLSVAVSAGAVTPYHLFRCISSLECQWYSNWELFVAHGPLTQALLQYAEVLSRSDSRIKFIECGDSDPSTYPTQALRQINGEFLVLLRCIDELHPSAFLDVVHTIGETGTADIIYTDESRTDECGRERQLVSKPDFDAELLTQQDYIGPFACLRTVAVLGAGGFRPEFGLQQNWDLLLRVAEASSPGNVRHLAKPVYRRRLHPEPLSPHFSKAIVASSLARRGRKAELREGLLPNSVRVKQPVDNLSAVAVFVRVIDGPQQFQILLRSRVPCEMRFLEIGFAGVYPCEPAAGGPLETIADLNATVAVFINRPLDHVNHEFWEELISQAQRSDCGVVGGLASEDIAFPKMVRTTRNLSSGFFATRVELLAEAGGMSSIHYDRMPELLDRLCELSERRGLKTVETPFSVATLRRNDTERSGPPVAVRSAAQAELVPPGL